MKLKRPEPLFIERDGGRCYRIDPPTRGAVRAAMKLDGEPGETTEEIDLRVAEQLRALLGAGAVEVDAETGLALEPAAKLDPDELTGEEERDLLHAILAMHHGEDPARAVAVRQALKKNALDLILASAASSGSTATP